MTDDAQLALLSAGLGAFVGSAATLAGEVFMRRRSDRLRFRSLLRGLAIEVAGIAELAEDRALKAGDLPRLQPPLPTAAWDVLVAAGYVAALPEEVAGLALNFYQMVRDANYLGAQVGPLLAIGFGTNDEETRSQFIERATEVAVTPFKALHGPAVELASRILAVATK